MANPENSNLFPPIIDTYMPVFIGESAYIKFQLSPYSSASDFNLGLVQIAVANQRTNKTSLDLTKYPNEIKLVSAILGADGMYSIPINGVDLKEGFQLNCYYKVQLRLTAADVVAPENNKITSNWLTSNYNNFSEWSTVCLIRKIATPTLEIEGLNNNILTVPNLIGTVFFDDSSETEGINRFVIQLTALSDEIGILDGAIKIYEQTTIYPSENLNNRSFNYTFKTDLTSLGNPNVTIITATRGGYVFRSSYQIVIKDFTKDPLIYLTGIKEDKENGLLQLACKIDDNFTDEENNIKKIIIKRTDNKSSFYTWEDLYTYNSFNFNLTKGVTFRWNDQSIESGIWYKYGLQLEYKDGTRSIIKKFNARPVMVLFENIYIIGDHGRQLKIKYNPNISSYKRVVQEAQITTIGNKYPYIRRNSDVNYKQFSISGLITSLSDEDLIQWYSNGKTCEMTNIEQGRLFTSPAEVYGGEDVAALYSEYNQDNNVTKYNDIIYERAFREKVIEFLNNGSAKLLKTHPEGNALVKLMNINLTPENQLGRNIYSFSCEAYEIEDNTPENYATYDILDTFVEIREV